MPDPIPASVQIARLVVAAVIALALLGAAVAGLLTGKLGGEAFAALALAALAAVGVGAVARGKRAPGDAPSKPPRGGAGFVGLELLVSAALAAGLALAAYGAPPALAVTLVLLPALAGATLYVLPRGRRTLRRGKRWLRLAAASAPIAFAALALSGCPLPPPDGCTPRDTRCAPDGVPEVCSSTQRWTRGAPSEPCPSGSMCCRALSPYGRALHACVPASACLPESPAVPTTPSASAESQ